MASPKPSIYGLKKHYTNIFGKFTYSLMWVAKCCYNFGWNKDEYLPIWHTYTVIPNRIKHEEFQNHLDSKTHIEVQKLST